MRLQQLKSLTDDEKALLLYVINDFGNRKPELSIDEIRWIKNEAIFWHLNQAQPKLNDAGKIVFIELIRKLKMNSYEELAEFTEKNKPEYTQLEFQLYSQFEFKF